MPPTISIVVTCFNYENFVEKCLQSIQIQTFSDFEVIIIDDGSTDRSAEKIKPFIKDSRFRYMWQENKGQTSAKNKGIQESKGKYIAFLDADDIWEPAKLAKQLPLFENNQIGVVYSTNSFINEEGTFLPPNKPTRHLQPKRGYVTDSLIYDNFVPFSSAMVRRCCFDEIGSFDEQLTMGIDWELWLRISTKYKFDFCDEPLLRYRVGHSGQMSKKILERFQCADFIINQFKNNHQGIIPEHLYKDAAYYTYCLRSYTLKDLSFKYTLEYYQKAVKTYPFRKEAHLNILKILAKKCLFKK